MNTAVSTKRILVVDDERAVCSSVEKILEETGMPEEELAMLFDLRRALPG